MEQAGAKPHRRGLVILLLMVAALMATLVFVLSLRIG